MQKCLQLALVCGLSLTAQTKIDWNTQLKNVPVNVTNAEQVPHKDINGGYVGRDTSGNVAIPGTATATAFQSSDTTHTSLIQVIPGLNTNFAVAIGTGLWGMFLDSANSNKLTRQDSMGNKVVIEGAAGGGGSIYTQSFTSQTSVALTHNMNLNPITAFTVSCYDSTNAVIYPSSVTATNAYTVTVTFAVATTGSCTVLGTGGGGGGGGISGPGTTVTGNVPLWSNTTGTALGAGLPVSTTSAASSLVETGAAGTIAANFIPTLNQSTTGNAATATALAAAPTQCTSPMFALGIAASGNANCGTPTSSGGGSVFTGSTAVTSTFSVTPTFSLADVSVKSPVRFEPGVMSANVTAVTFTNKTAGAKFSIVWTQASSGGPYTVTYGASVTGGNPCTVSATASVWTEQAFEVGSDGASVYATICSTNETPFAILNANERAAPTTAVAGIANMWPDSTRHTWTATENGAVAQHIMPRCAGTTDQCASSDLSDTANIGLLNAVQTYTGNKTFTGTATFGSTTLSGITGSTQCLHVNTTGLISGTGSDCGSSGGGGITGPGTTTVGYVPQWSNTAGTTVSAGLPVATTSTANSIVETGAGGTINANFVPTLNQNTTGTAANVTGIVAAANGGTGANNTVGAAGHYLRSNGTSYVDNTIQVADVPTLNQSTTGNATTATTATNVAGGALGSVPYQSAAATTALLAGNTAATDQVLVSHGTGTVSAAPTFNNAPALSAANMTSFPTLNQSTTGNAATATTATTATNVAGGALGSIHYQSAAATTAMLAGNTAATDQVLVSHGTGTVSAAPTFSNAPALSAANMTSFPANVTLTIANNTTAMPTTAVAANACDAAATTGTATGAATTDAAEVTYAADPTGVTGYGGGTAGGITIRVWITANTINFKRCNETGSSITPGALSLNWRIAR